MTQHGGRCRPATLWYYQTVRFHSALRPGVGRAVRSGDRDRGAAVTWPGQRHLFYAKEETVGDPRRIDWDDILDALPTPDPEPDDDE